MNRSEALRLWKRIAEGELERDSSDDPVDLHSWIREVARKLIEVDDIPSKKRVGEIVRAVHLYNKTDKHAELRRVLGIVEEFRSLDSNGNEVPDVRGLRMRRLIAIARAWGLVDTLASDIEVAKLIDRQLPRQL